MKRTPPVAADVTACVKTPDRGIESKNRPPNFGYDALFRTARVPTTLFSLFQNAILEFLHKLVRSREVDALEPGTAFRDLTVAATVGRPRCSSFWIAW